MADYINKNKLKDALRNLYRYESFPIADIEQLIESISRIDSISRMDMEPVKHGHWVHGKELSRDYIGDVCVSIHYDKCWCSECNYPVEGHPLWIYCPNCGAKMDEVE